jgi:hypothetical protein
MRNWNPSALSFIISFEPSWTITPKIVRILVPVLACVIPGCSSPWPSFVPVATLPVDRGCSTLRKGSVRCLILDKNTSQLTRGAIDFLKQFLQGLITSRRWDAKNFRVLVNELQSYSLISLTPDQSAFSIHPLLQERVRNTLDARDQAALNQSATILLTSVVLVNTSRTADSERACTTCRQSAEEC